MSAVVNWAPISVSVSSPSVELIDERLERGSASVPGALEVDADLGEDPAGVGAEHDDPVGEQHGFLDVVGDDADRLGREVLARP
jgi:hypothetical protein